MPLPVERLRSAALEQLTDRERQSCVVYLATQPIARNEQLTFPHLSFTAPWAGYLTFVDLDPMANWGHACCYFCIDTDTQSVRRVDAQFPPFGPADSERAARRWQVIYRAPGVPEALLAIREQ